MGLCQQYRLGVSWQQGLLLALRRGGEAPTYAAAPHEWESDFVTPRLAIQCCARLTPENRARELCDLLAAATLPDAAGGTPRELFVLTLDQADALVENRRAIKVIPVWEWLD